MSLNRTIVRTGVVAAVLAGGLVAVAPNAFADPAWSIVPTPDPAANSAFLQDVSCPATTTCVAVGYTGGGAGPAHLLTEQWNGTIWTKTARPTPVGATFAQLSGVSCASLSSCIAVGTYSTASGRHPLAERWNGTSWSILPTAAPPAGAGGFAGVDCSSAAACTAVGNQGSPEQTLAERWNGTTWTVQSTPDPTGVFDDSFEGVACPSDTVCFAIGIDDTNTGGHSIAAVWRTGSWHAVAVPEPAGATQTGLLGVDCGAVGRCQAVGFAIGSPEPGLLAESWDGLTLTPASVPGPSGWSTGELSGVSCTSGTVCRAVGQAEDSGGFSKPLAAVLRTGAWSAQSVAVPPGTYQAALSATDCAAGTACTAVGDVFPGAGGSLTLAAHSSGGNWTPQRTPPASPTQDSTLLGVDCLGVSDCASVGSTVASADQPIAQSWDGTRWTFSPAAGGPGAASSTFQAVSCAAGSCTGVGPYTDSHGHQRIFAATRTTTPFGWSTVRTVPLPSGASSGTLTGVSCVSATFCVAVGDWFDGLAQEHPLIESFNGSSWTVQTAAEPAAQSGLSAVSCATAAACLAVGGDETGAAVAESWNGVSWQLASPPAVGGSTFAVLAGVSCRTATSCTAVGVTDTNSGVLLATRTSGTWLRRAATLPAGVTSGQLSGVSCPTGTTTCTAVGQASTSSGGAPLAVQGTGAAWTGTLLPVPAGANSATLTSVRCFSAVSCQAVGASVDGDGLHSTLAEQLH